ncbi:glutamate ABC transporter substrate-binding protein [Pseudofrankia inefficax]|uniref:Extracellular solute-binding protein family 3 n=1 Tax=Pseudofrankia inefficax (strain DSM 45817 / CECT 9037 / DDB 130130 / EuI1c) TaxID=298654 RepID=E3JBY4_PSEI1|nr:glutamate ABC transporter substrate-binding protein [Pseudofrankia inefficax]ADP82294.1 extracellular solute-binding protein family 3 [Pseudofrankia inefficax]
MFARTRLSARVSAVTVGLAAAIALTLAACGGSDPGPGAAPAGTAKATSGYKMTQATAFPASATLDRIRQRGELIVGTKFDQPLFGLQNPTTGKIEGFDTEIARLLSIRIFGSPDKVKFVETVSKNREPFIQQGKVDVVVATYTINDARKKLVDFAGPYYTAGQDIMVKAGDTTVHGVTDLNGKKVCTVEGSTSETNLRAKAPGASVVLVDTYSSCAEQLLDGRVDAVTTDNVVLLGLVSQHKDALKLVGTAFTSEPYGIGLIKGDDGFRAFLNDTLDEAYRNGDWASAFRSTVGTVATTVPATPTIDRYVA